ncbi:MAG: hypothetical protein CR972_02615 [Candidatus Moraniibacteriota bacterium]|nr:MAG: hypothetical protein CR972_02615 [Candidatus Moranbacteria bacterium]
MKIEVKVVPRAHKNCVEKKEGKYIVRTTTIPEDGKANVHVIMLLAKYFGVAKSCVNIVRGHAVRNKIVEIEDECFKKKI